MSIFNHSLPIVIVVVVVIINA